MFLETLFERPDAPIKLKSLDLSAIKEPTIRAGVRLFIIASKEGGLNLLMQLIFAQLTFAEEIVCCRKLFDPNLTIEQCVFISGMVNGYGLRVFLEVIQRGSLWWVDMIRVALLREAVLDHHLEWADG